MKACVFFVLLIGATSAQLVIPTLKDLDLSNLAGVQLLTKAFGLETVLNKAGSLFVEKFKDGGFLKGQSPAETLKNFIANARGILTGPAKEWQQALNIELLGLSAQQFENLLALRAPAATKENNSSDNSTVPSSVDWRTKGAVSPVKNQGQCGSCWAFAAVGALEGRIGIKTGKTPVLSEQNLIDCAKNVNGSSCCAGCDGGWITDGYNYVELNNGIDSNASYPYEAKNNDQCKYDPAGASGNSVGFEYVASDEESLKRAVAQGPVAVAVDATGMQSYSGGIVKCYSDKPLNHGVVIVGYGSDGFMGDHWIVKNSWGASWGDKGFFKLTRNAKYACGVYKRANYPLV